MKSLVSTEEISKREIKEALCREKCEKSMKVLPVKKENGFYFT